MKFKNGLRQLNLPAQCKKYGLSLWQCPPFLFLVMGGIIIISSLIAWAIGTRYIEDPGQVALIVLGLSAVLFVLAFSITQNFEKLAEANKMKSEFINIVSHQLRNPLSILSWGVELLTSGRLGQVGEKQVEYFKILKENTTRMKELVSDLLIVSRLETATMPFKKEEISLSDVVSRLVQKTAPFAKASNIEVEFKEGQDLPKVLADPSQLRTVVENLLDNAIRYIKDKGEVEIFLAKKNSNVYFEIKDTGVGIPPEDQKYIFQKFFRAGNVMKYQTQGSGLGLYIVKSVIERSGGKIGFKSQEGKGSTFWFTLPIR